MSASKSEPSSLKLAPQSLLARAKSALSASDPALAQRALERARERDCEGTLAALLDRESKAQELLIGVFGGSPFLGDIAARDPARLARLLLAPPEESLAALLCRVQAARPETEAEAMGALRSAKQEAALLIGLADLAQVWEAESVMRALTVFADVTLSATIDFTLRQAAETGSLTLPDPDEPARGSGWIFLAMGKGGACELNYSSDLDLVVLFDRARTRLAKPDEDWDFFVRLTQRVVRIMSERTADGYVFRLDLRLRPDPGATPIVLPLEAAYAYYESMGQNWERAAFIKARAAAGDIESGEIFLRELQPFIWRKHYDFAALADVHSIKRQIHAHKGHGVVAVNGHDVKLGRGGIREIEFFVQTQQLIVGGRDASLRGRSTLAMLDRLAEAGWIEALARDELREAYLFLRSVEHRLQMVEDRQTHALPLSDEGVAAIGRMMGFAGYDDFAPALRRRLETVESHYARLFEGAPELSAAGGNLVFTGDDDDPETLATLSRLGYQRPRLVTESLRAWHFGRVPAMRSARARERLTELTPALLEALAATGEADEAFLAFDKFMNRLPAGLQLFSLLAANPHLLRLVATIMGSAPKLAETISRRPRVIAALIEPASAGRDDLSQRLRAALAEARSYEEALDRARIFGQEQKFLIGVRLMAMELTPAAAGVAYADLAEVLIRGLLQRVEEEFVTAHGRIEGGSAAVVALGKLGGREMTAASDLDLMLLYDADPLTESRGGETYWSAAQYYARFTQRLISALSAPTAEGLLYEVDFRLRPSGNKGPIAVRLQAFEEYQAHEAWTWERMALTRARVVAGPAEFSARVETAIAAALSHPHDARSIAADALDMRRRLEREKGTGGLWDLKQAPGGQIDIEFVTQFLELTRRRADGRRFSTSIAEALQEFAGIGALAEGDITTLSEATTLYQGLTQILRLAISENFDPKKASRGLTGLVLGAGDAPDLSRLEARLAETQASVREIFARIIGAA
ncbi:MAG: bifunctional [glutamine synthetase] adenylyltransferase/[glutamine synthetase]-adenylyl-L-tyrosine phosphorylase [Methylocystis sp.]